jgi:hypothetical protein
MFDARQAAMAEARDRRQVGWDSELEAQHQVVLALGQVEVADDFDDGDDDRQQVDRPRPHLVDGAGGDVLTQCCISVISIACSSATWRRIRWRSGGYGPP